MTMAGGTSGRVLVIRAARPMVLDAFLARCGSEAPVAVLGHVTSERSTVRPVEWLAAPAGPLRWRRFGPALRTVLRRGWWSEVVVLHNQGDDSYAAVHAIVARIAPVTRFRICFADGTERAYGSWLAFFVRRAPLVTAASLMLPLVVACLLPFWIGARVARWRTRSRPAGEAAA